MDFGSLTPGELRRAQRGSRRRRGNGVDVAGAIGWHVLPALPSEVSGDEVVEQDKQMVDDIVKGVDDGKTVTEVKQDACGLVHGETEDGMNLPTFETVDKPTEDEINMIVQEACGIGKIMEHQAAERLDVGGAEGWHVLPVLPSEVSGGEAVEQDKTMVDDDMEDVDDGKTDTEVVQVACSMVHGETKTDLNLPTFVTVDEPMEDEVVKGVDDGKAIIKIVQEACGMEKISKYKYTERLRERFRKDETKEGVVVGKTVPKIVQEAYGMEEIDKYKETQRYRMRERFRMESCRWTSIAHGG